ncbi:MAG: colanic acid biosynthesis glycosyltransferase WcaL [bacterium]|nr:colanic acid biosynthesis glycosyltransferase WcaL [bacterium]
MNVNMNMNGKTPPLPAAAQFNTSFFVKSETFIYHYLSHMKTFTPLCLTWKIQNLDQFPFPRGNIYSLQLPKYSLKWYWNGFFKRLLKRDFHFEHVLKERGVKLMHAHFGHNGVQAMQLIRKLNIPLVTTFYGADLSRKDMIRPLKKQYRQLFDGGQMFLVEGEHMKEKLHGLGCPKKKIHIQRIAIPVDTIPLKERKPNGEKGVKLLFCGRFTEKKGLIYALKAIKKVRDQNREVSFCAIGDGELKEEIEAYVQQHNLTHCVELPGFLSYRDYLKKVETADIFIHPSVTADDGDSEGGAPTTILEAQAMGLPIISTHHADIPNIVVPDRSALLSPERDADALARNILFLLDNKHLWSQMGKTGRAFVEEFHDIKKETVKLETKYQQLISQNKK